MAEITKETKRTSLGRGLGSLFGDDIFDDSPAKTASPNNHPAQSAEQTRPQPAAELKESDSAIDQSRIWQVDIERLIPNQFQPRKEFSVEKIQELTASIKEKGILQPILVRRSGDRYEIIAGERRWRASQAAGLHRVPVIVHAAKNQESLELALIENIQRHDLNPLEEALGYEQLINEFGLTQQEVATKVGKDRATVANMLRLLTLPQEVKLLISNGEISVGHAKALLALQDPIKQKELAKRIHSEKLTVRAAEKLIQSMDRRRSHAGEGASALAQLDVAKQLVQGLSEDLRKTLGTKVEIVYNSGRGKIDISFYSDDDLNRIIERIKR